MATRGVMLLLLIVALLVGGGRGFRLLGSSGLGLGSRRQHQTTGSTLAAASGDEDVDDGGNWGFEYRNAFPPTKTGAEMAPTKYWKGKPYRQIQSKDRGRVMKGYDQLRSTFLLDSIFVCCLGLSATWYFGTLKDVTSFGIGSVLGLAYAVLLGRYVESVGGKGGGGAGAARFAPVILLVALYGKYRTQISIIPELLGFFCYQAASLLQIWNESAYQEKEEGS